MHIIVIGWLFVASMLAISAQSLFMGVMAFIDWGVIPVTLLIYLFGRKKARGGQTRKP